MPQPNRHRINNSMFENSPNELKQRALTSDISILKGIGGWAIIFFNKDSEQVVEYATSMDQLLTIVREQLEALAV